MLRPNVVYISNWSLNSKERLHSTFWWQYCRIKQATWMLQQCRKSFLVCWSPGSVDDSFGARTWKMRSLTWPGCLGFMFSGREVYAFELQTKNLVGKVKNESDSANDAEMDVWSYHFWHNSHGDIQYQAERDCLYLFVWHTMVWTERGKEEKNTRWWVFNEWSIKENYNSLGSLLLPFLTLPLLVTTAIPTTKQLFSSFPYPKVYIPGFDSSYRTASWEIQHTQARIMVPIKSYWAPRQCSQK